MNRRDEIKTILSQHQRQAPKGAMIERCICGAVPLLHIDHLTDMLLAVGPQS